MNSFHSNPDGTLNQKHFKRDTSVDRVLISGDFVYFGGEGPLVPEELKGAKHNLVHVGRRQKRLTDDTFIGEFEEWVRCLGVTGYQGRPWDRVRVTGKK